MIVSIESSLSTFKAVHFQEGLNVLLADTRPGSTEKQTRNSAGKTSLVEIIHFLMGSNCDKNSLFRTPGLIEHTFTGSFMIAGETYHGPTRGLRTGQDILAFWRRSAGRFSKEDGQRERPLLYQQYQLAHLLGSRHVWNAG